MKPVYLCSRNICRGHAFLILTFLVFYSSTAIAQNVPGAATVGGATSKPETRKIPAPTTLEDKYIMPVPDRPLEVDEGERIQVVSFILQGVQDHPENKILVSEIEELVMMASPELPGSMTIGQLQLVADKVTDYYRQHGFILAKAYIPEQTVTNGQVVLAVLEGRLGLLSFEGNEMYSDKVLGRAFKELVGKPLTVKSAESAMLHVMDLPGLEFQGVFKAGENVGETDLTIKVSEEDRFKFSLSADNYGSRYTGEFRLIGDVQVNNPIGQGDVFHLTALGTFDPENALYGSINYELPLLTPGLALGAGVNHDTFDVGREFESLDAEGVKSEAFVYVSNSFIKGKKKNLDTILDFAWKKSEIDMPGTDFDTEDKLSVLSAEIKGDLIDTLGKGGINIGSIRYSHGFGDLWGSMEAENAPNSSRTGANGLKAGAEFDKITGQFSRLQLLHKDISALLRFGGQWSDDLLVSIEQFSLSGPGKVRAYPPSELLRDSAFFGSFELLFNSPGFADKHAMGNYTWGQMLQFSVFFDYAKGDLNEPLASEEELKDQALYGAGIGIKFVYPERFQADLSFAVPTDDYDTDNLNGNYDYQIYSSIIFLF